MPNDETIQNPDELAEKQVTETPEDRVVESPAETQVKPDPFVMPESLKTRYKSVEELDSFARQKQAEADRYKAQLEVYQRNYPQQQSGPTPDELLDQIAKDPLGFIGKEVERRMTPVLATVAWTEFARTHSNAEAYRAEMKDYAEKNPSVFNDPQGLDMLYVYIDNKHQAGKAVEASQKVQEHRDEVNRIKGTEAFVESSTSPKRTQPPAFTPGMTTAEKDKVLDEMGIGWISDDERHIL